MSSLSIPDLAKQLAALTDAQALDLLSSIEGLTARAAAHKTAMAAAEAERDAWAPRLVCGCGEPATVCRYVRWEQADIRLGIQTWRSTGPKGGIIATHSDCEDSPSNDVDVEQVEGDLWVSCSKEECVWVRIPGGHAGIVGWE
jgi:hypothetical protein